MITIDNKYNFGDIMETNNKLEAVKRFIKEHEELGYYLTKDGRVGDAYGPMNGYRYTDIDTFCKENRIGQ